MEEINLKSNLNYVFRMALKEKKMNVQNVGKIKELIFTNVEFGPVEEKEFKEAITFMPNLEKIEIESSSIKITKFPKISLKTIIIRNTNLFSVNLNDVQADEMILENCNITSVQKFKNNSRLDSLTIVEKKKKELDLDRVMVNVISSYPNIDTMYIEDKMKIFAKYDCYVERYPEFNMEGIEEFLNLTSLNLNGIIFNKENTVKFKPMSSIKQFGILTSDELDVTWLNNFPNLEKIRIELENIHDVTGIEELKKISKLYRIELRRVKNYLEALNFTNNNSMEIILHNCDILDLEFVKKYKKIDLLDVCSNPISPKNGDLIKELFEDQGTKIIFDDTDLKKSLENKVFEFNTVDTLNYIKEKLNIEKESITYYDIWNIHFVNDEIDVDLEMYKDFVRQNLLDIFRIKKVTIHLKANEFVSSAISSMREKNIQYHLIIDSILSISSEDLNSMESIRNRIILDVTNCIKPDYTFIEYRIMRERLEKIVRRIKKEKTNKEKITVLYKILKEYITLDSDAVLDKSVTNKTWLQMIARSFYGALVEQIAVSFTIAALFSKACYECDIQSSIVYVNIEGNKHYFNKVKIDDTWKYVDVARDIEKNSEDNLLFNHEAIANLGEIYLYEA